MPQANCGDEITEIVKFNKTHMEGCIACFFPQGLAATLQLGVLDIFPTDIKVRAKDNNDNPINNANMQAIPEAQDARPNATWDALGLPPAQGSDAEAPKNPKIAKLPKVFFVLLGYEVVDQGYSLNDPIPAEQDLPEGLQEWFGSLCHLQNKNNRTGLLVTTMLFDTALADGGTFFGGLSGDCTLTPETVSIGTEEHETCPEVVEESLTAFLDAAHNLKPSLGEGQPNTPPTLPDQTPGAPFTLNAETLVPLITALLQASNLADPDSNASANKAAIADLFDILPNDAFMAVFFWIFSK